MRTIFYTALLFVVLSYTTMQAAVRNCSSIQRHDAMADCYFRAGEWQKVIRAFNTTPPRSLDYPTEGAQNRAEVIGYYERAVAYKHLGNLKEERTWIYLAHFGDPQKWVSPALWAKIETEYASSGERAQNAPVAAEQHADAAWGQEQGMSPEEVALVKYRGKPCHFETYEGQSSYHTETFWYCNADGSYAEAYTFTNGHQTSHYVP